MNARYDSEHAYITHQTLMMGLAAGGGIGDIPSMSQSYRRAVTRNPPKGEYLLTVLPPQKQGSNWHYGGRVVAAPSNSSPKSPSPSNQDFKEFTIWRKWEDCLDLQKTVEREFSFFSSQRRKRQLMELNAPPTLNPTKGGGGQPGRPSSPEGGGNHFYIQPTHKAASFDSLPSGPEPLSMALDVHTLLPKLSKKTALFGRPNQQLLAQRAEDFRTFVEALFNVQTPVMEDVRQSREVRDWFGYWKRDKEGARKAAAQHTANGLQAPASPASSASSPHDPNGELPLHQPSTNMVSNDSSKLASLTLPPANIQLEHRSSSTTSASSDGSSSSIAMEEHDASGSEADGEELLDTFPPTPSAGPGSTQSSPIIRTTGDSSNSSHSSHRSPGGIQPPNQAFAQNAAPPPQIMMPPSSRLVKKSPGQNSYLGYSVGGMMAPVPLFKPKSAGPSNGRPSTAPQRPRGPPMTPTSHTFAAPAALVPSSQTGPIVRPSRLQRPSTANPALGGGPGSFSSSTAGNLNRQGRVFMDQLEEPQRPRSANSGSGGSRGVSSPTPTPEMQPTYPLGLRADNLSVERERSASAVEATHPFLFPGNASSYHRPRANTLASTPHPPDSVASETSTFVDPHERDPSAFLLHRAPDDFQEHQLAVGSLLRKFHHARKVSAASSFADTASFLDMALPAWTAAPASVQGGNSSEDLSLRSRTSQKLGRRSRGSRRSISSMESYLSDSSIDAALSTLRMGSTTPQQRTVGMDSASPKGSSSLRRSMSTGASGVRMGDRSVPVSIVSRVPEESDYECAPKDSNRRQNSVLRRKIQHVLDEDEDVVDSYFYNPTRSGPATPTTASSFAPDSARPIAGGQPDEVFSLKVLFPSFSDCAAIALRLPRSTSFEELQCRLHIKFHEAEGIDLTKFAKGFRLGYKPSIGGLGRRGSITGPTVNGRTRSISTGSGSMVDPSILFIIKNNADWRSVIPGPREKIVIQVIIDA